MSVAPVEAVLFDFSGTLFRFTERPEWFSELHDEDGSPIDVGLQAELIRRMTAPTGVPSDLDPDDVRAWERRDLDPELHRRAYLAVLRASGLRVPGHAESLYERVLDPASWDPYPDTAEVLHALHDRGVPVGIVSNIAFDLRRVLARVDLDGLVAAWALSHEVGAVKPAPDLFTAALDALGVPADRALMVGDSEEADGGARALGCRFALVQPDPIPDRPRALLDAVAAYGLL
ncbi:HAD family hydrolase [Williamsia deligens]|uniref:HAD family hydrolase n=1 Tax=Williamsia deligens TaxID=321325 RepID=A0ABW3G9K3_9NOCA|nr:HAD family hydrolase [Williamsia deligens]MCP2192392.1 Haloacid dehalogenase superfamily, subfamily IA, variant 2 with 3rd motif like haloacid dehalogenase/haloacid dehalogenase superfamily, subfamily IA, variant 3 with third motif having DD or ED/haloacid dehalogenase superfamily, subfamily IA, variant 1 with third motif having Dx(3-4)D or Dx(3-4)E [Williamsia deligens]